MRESILGQNYHSTQLHSRACLQSQMQKCLSVWLSQVCKEIIFFLLFAYILIFRLQIFNNLVSD